MAKTETLHIRVNDSVKSTAEETLGKLGITVSEAVNMFLCQVNLTGGIPFEVKLPAPERIVANSDEELRRKLDEAEADIADGRVTDGKTAIAELRAKYGL
jgi:DNA-damage-inducible protein J